MASTVPPITRAAAMTRKSPTVAAVGLFRWATPRVTASSEGLLVVVVPGRRR